MAKDKEKETAPKLNFDGTIARSKYRVEGIRVHTSDGKAEQNLEQLLEKTEKDEVMSARKDNIVSKLKKQSEPNPKRYTVDPETGRIDIDEEGGEYTQKDAMMVSASIKGRSGQYDAAIGLITAAKALAPEKENQPNMAEKPKEFYVDPDTGAIFKDAENGEYTLSEARAISQSLHKERQAAQQGPRSFLDKLEEVTEGLVSKRIASMFGGDNNSPQPKDPVDEFFNRLDQVEKVKQRFGNPGGGGAQALAQSGIRGELLKLMLEDERERIKMQYEHETQVDRNKHLGTLASTVKENFADGISALRAAATEFKATGTEDKISPPATQPQSFVCGDCGMKFSPPAEWAGQALKCPNPACGREYTKEELLA